MADLFEWMVTNVASILCLNLGLVNITTHRFRLMAANLVARNQVVLGGQPR